MSVIKGIFGSIRILSAFVLNGIVPLSLFYLSGALNLVGSESQIIYLVPGFLAGGLLFSIMGALISKVRWSALISLVAGAALIASLFVLVNFDKVLLPSSAFSYGFISEAPCMFLLAISSKEYLENFFSRLVVVKATLFGFSPLFLALLYAIIYIKSGQAHLVNSLIPGQVISILLLLVSILLPVQAQSRGVPSNNA
ncbi:MAG: hypothetical protein M1306_05020 [Candidatus Thermoplasmatota archaeon]|jgi:hypothetical protein|nr:hypothetical protein [Candidatus Thermoplasmatota archaeon]